MDTDIDFAGRLIVTRLTELRREIESYEDRIETANTMLELLTQEKAQLEAALEKLGS